MLDEVHFVQCHLLGGGERDRCIVPHGVAVAMARMGYIVLRLCMMNTLPTNPPVGRYMPVNYCTFGEGKKEKKVERGKTEMRST